MFKSLENFRKKRLACVAHYNIGHCIENFFNWKWVNFNCYFLQYNTGLYLESLAVELVVLAIWKKALDICSTWLPPISEGELPRSSSVNESIIASGDPGLSQTTEKEINFSDCLSVSLWAKRGFIIAVDRAEKLSCHIQSMDGRISFLFLNLNLSYHLSKS
jgi:hypothetical protein